jgi:hypothetical protein
MSNPMVVHRVSKRISEFEWTETLRACSAIKLSPHSVFRLDESQRNVYKESDLGIVLRDEKAVFIGELVNKNWSLYYPRKQGYLRVIVRIDKKLKRIAIVTFYMTDVLPQV